MSTGLQFSCFSVHSIPSRHPNNASSAPLNSRSSSKQIIYSTMRPSVFLQFPLATASPVVQTTRSPRSLLITRSASPPGLSFYPPHPTSLPTLHHWHSLPQIYFGPAPDGPLATCDDLFVTPPAWRPILLSVHLSVSSLLATFLPPATSPFL